LTAVVRRIVVMLEEVADEELALALRLEKEAKPNRVEQRPCHGVHEVEGQSLREHSSANDVDRDQEQLKVGSPRRHVNNGCHGQPKQQTYLSASKFAKAITSLRK
jgi:hypothetical protein